MQESLQNIAKHSGSARVRVVLENTPDEMRLTGVPYTEIAKRGGGDEIAGTAKTSIWTDAVFIAAASKTVAEETGGAGVSGTTTLFELSAGAADCQVRAAVTPLLAFAN